MTKSIEPDIACHEKKNCVNRLYSTTDEECRACAGEEPLPPDYMKEKMIDVPIIYIQDSFFSEGVEYRYESSYNSRIVCRRADDPTIDIQFSAYDTVQVTEEHAMKIKFVLKEALPNSRRSVREMEETLKSLEDQKVPDLYETGS